MEIPKEKRWIEDNHKTSVFHVFTYDTVGLCENKREEKGELRQVGT